MRLVPKPHVYYTDGSAHPNPGPGGWAVVRDGRLLASGSEPCTTNQRMELSAMLAALSLIAETVSAEHPLDGSRTAADGRTGARRYDHTRRGLRRSEVRSDSQYALNCVSSASTWQANGWRRSNSAPLKNLDLIQQVCTMYHLAGPVTLTHVRGHHGVVGNEMADHHAALARLSGIMSEGEGGDACR